MLFQYSQRDFQKIPGPVGWGGRLHRMHHCREVRLPPKLSWYDTKQSDGEAQIILQFWGMRSTSLLPLLPSPLWHAVVVPDWVLSTGQIELKWIVWNRTEVRGKFNGWYLFMYSAVQTPQENAGGSLTIFFITLRQACFLRGTLSWWDASVS